MEKFAAERFFVTGIWLTEVGGYDPTSDRSRLLAKLRAITAELESIGLKVSLRAMRRVMATANSTPFESLELASDVNTLRDVIRWEMQEHVFMHIPASRSERYGVQESFGSAVHNNFRSAQFDILEAGNSYAVGRYTACVFHLMRALEIALGALAAEFSVPFDHTNWHNIIEQLESKIRDMGKDPNKAADWKTQQEFYAQAANSFMFFKDAWRNYTAHARGKYTEEEADAIYRNVNSFMKKLADGELAE